MLDAFRALSLGSLCSGWNLMLDFGVCESLEVELKDFLVANATAVFKGDIAEDNRQRARLMPILQSVAMSASVLQRTAGSISRYLTARLLFLASFYVLEDRYNRTYSSNDSVASIAVS
jgi:hypothetical protein